MASVVPSRCVFCRLLPIVGPGPQCRSFTTRGSQMAKASKSPLGKAARERLAQMTRTAPTKRKPQDPQLRAAKKASALEQIDSRLEAMRPYSERERQLLALKYTPAQLRTIEIGEKAIDPVDVATQAKRRDSPMTLEYRDDFSKILPVVDKPVRAPTDDTDLGIRMLSDDETTARFGDWTLDFAERQLAFEARREGYKTSEAAHVADIERITKKADIHPGDGRTPAQRMAKWRELAEYIQGPDLNAEFESFVSDPENFAYSPKGTLNTQPSALSVDLPRMNDPDWTYADLEQDPNMVMLSRRTGRSEREIRALRVKVLVFHRVVNQTHMGKIEHYYSLAVAGNENGMLGIGEGNAVEPNDSRQQCQNAAILNMKPIPRYEARTIFGDIEGKVCASVVKLGSRPPGFGNRCQSLIFELARAAGIHDLAARCVRSKNPMNVVKATYKALLGQRLPEDIARARGIKMVDVRKVYYQGLV